MLSAFELKQLRKAIGVNISTMASMLGLSGDNANDHVRKMENGNKSISGPIQRLAKYMQQGTPLNVETDAIFPRFLICDDLHCEIEQEIVFHTRYPRFLATPLDEPHPGMNCVSADGIEWLCVFMWIDEPIGDEVDGLLEECAVVFAEYTDRAMDSV